MIKALVVYNKSCIGVLRSEDEVITLELKDERDVFNKFELVTGHPYYRINMVKYLEDEIDDNNYEG